MRLAPSALFPCFPLLQGAVLEPQGVVEIKFRTPELVAAMHRLDPVILKLKARHLPAV
jgi:acetyl-CoA carboxylase/biotin carboxylase 1